MPSRSCATCRWYDTTPSQYIGSWEAYRHFFLADKTSGICRKAATEFKSVPTSLCPLHEDRERWPTWLLDLLVPRWQLRHLRAAAQIELDSRAAAVDALHCTRAALRCAWQALVRSHEATGRLRTQLDPLIEAHTTCWRTAAQYGEPPPSEFILPLEDDPRLWEGLIRAVWVPVNWAILDIRQGAPRAVLDILSETGEDLLKEPISYE
jgi:hypothetical protein